MLVAVEGLDGVGKTSTAKELAKMIDGTYFSKGFHLMRDTTGKYDNFTSIAECIGTDFNIISEYGTRSTFLYCKQKKYDIVTDRYFCTNYAAKPDDKTIKEIALDIGVLGVPDLTFILYCDPQINYQRMYNRNSNDKDFYKLKQHKSFYDNLIFCAKIFNFNYEIIDTTSLDLYQVVQLLSKKITDHKADNAVLANLNNKNENTLLIKSDDEISEIARNHVNLNYIHNLNIGSDVKFISYAFIDLLPNLHRIDVHSNNLKYKSDNGVLFSHSLDKLICLPAKYAQKDFSLPVEVKKIGYCAFKNCAIESIVIDDLCYEIGYLAFCNCKKLKKVRFSDNVSKIGNMAFVGCNPLLIIEPCNSIFSFNEGELFDCENNIVSAFNTSSEIIKSNKISAWAFAGNSKIKNIITFDLKRIGPYAFVDSSLERLTINSQVDIHDYAFWNCNHLKEIEFNTDLIPRIAHELFYNIGHAVRVVVPSSVVNKYKDAFKNCINDIYFEGK